MKQINGFKRLTKKQLDDFYAVMNMIYSDYYNPKFDIETYVELAKDWLDDVDIGNCKTLKYYIYIATANPCTK
jgi:hypothetical protein